VEIALLRAEGRRVDLWFDNIGDSAGTRLTRMGRISLEFHSWTPRHGRSIKLCLYAERQQGEPRVSWRRSLGDTAIYPDGATLKNLLYHFFNRPNLQRVITRMWTKFKSGSILESLFQVRKP